MARTNKSRAPALAYLRTSSAANVGTDKDSEKRQRHAIQGFAKRAGYKASSMSCLRGGRRCGPYRRHERASRPFSIGLRSVGRIWEAAPSTP